MTTTHTRPEAPGRPAPRSDLGTHEVTNQVPPRSGGDLLSADPALAEALGREGGDPAAVDRLAAVVGTDEHREHARAANVHEPQLRSHDRTGHRIDEVGFHPSWHELMRTSVEHGLAAAPWTAAPGTGAHVTRAAGFYLTSQVEQGHLCPISMTYAAVPALRHAPDLAAAYEPGLAARSYEPGLADPAAKTGLLAGMSMTEKQGGSDVRAGTTVAHHQPDGSYRLTGHKWFTSAPMNDLFLTLAQAPGGLTCLVLPRVLPDGTRNAIHLQRLKDKLGNRSNASSEIEYHGAVGWRVGDEGRGVRTIIEMVSMTRLDCVLGAAGTQRAAVTEAAHHVAHRSAFGARLADQPLMREVVADLAAETEAATVLALRLAGAVDRSAGDPAEGALLRLALPVTKYLVCKRTSAVVAEALECLGGNGYVEESDLPRLYREAPLNSIWEGSGNVTALDALRAIAREPHAVDALLAEIDLTSGADPRLDACVAALRTELAAPQERRARRLAELAALALQGSLLVRHAPDPVAQVFLATRLDADGPLRTAGARPGSDAVGALLERATPQAG
ncbi:putative acyl-CoA dehydrogenase [Pseudonocardia ammonioxydans]|uniref:Putative acyl-CoA dehydrogenase n=1 Tax=Pseudonocardia ammonioxydans TaxID=260086 RepID=A0A1I5G5X6_PSUAM|nr:putative acyl-CoA dehydrogenase [Pseudonocardia ammonioxydans]